MTTERELERARQGMHVAAAALAVLLRYLTWWEAAILAGAAVGFNRYALPRLAGKRLYRTAARPARSSRGGAVPR